MWSARLEFSTSTKMARRPVGSGGGGAAGLTRPAKARSGVAVRTASAVVSGSGGSAGGGAATRVRVGLLGLVLTGFRDRLGIGRFFFAMADEPSTSARGAVGRNPCGTLYASIRARTAPSTASIRRPRTVATVGRHVAAPDRAQGHVAPDSRAGGQEEGRVIAVERALTVGAQVLRRAVLLRALRGVAVGVAGRGLEHHVGHLGVLAGRGQAQGAVLRGGPHAAHAFHGRDLPGELVHRGEVAVEPVERARAVIHHEARLALRPSARSFTLGRISRCDGRKPWSDTTNTVVRSRPGSPSESRKRPIRPSTYSSAQ